MGNRLSKIRTRTGDKGDTGLANGTRVAKDCLRMEAIGTVDELNSLLGLVLANDIDDEVFDALTDVQHELFDLGGELSVPDNDTLNELYVDRLDTLLDQLNCELPPLREFILPAGGPATAACHVARAVCRRTERRLVSLAREENVNPVSIVYLNRLSDLLFVIARVLARQEFGEEVLWKPGRGEPPE
jgi:cob(I)alamin adenosyltransferase